MEIKTEYKIGKKTAKEWSGVYGYRPDIQADLLRLGSMYAVVRVASHSEDFAIEKFSKIVVEELQNAYFNDLVTYRSALQRLEESCWKMKSKIDLILSRESELADMGIDIEMAVVIIKEEYLYAATIGESKIFIYRESKAVDITSALVDNARTGFVKTASLQLEESDRICIATSKIAKNTEKIEESLSLLNVNIIGGKTPKSGFAAMLIANESEDWFMEKPQEVLEEKVLDKTLNEDIDIKSIAENEETDSKNFEQAPEVEEVLPKEKTANEDTSLTKLSELENFKEEEPFEFDQDTENTIEEDDKKESVFKSNLSKIKNKVKSSLIGSKNFAAIKTLQVKQFSASKISAVKAKFNPQKTVKTYSPEQDSSTEDTTNSRPVNNKSTKVLEIPSKIKKYFESNQITYLYYVKKFLESVNSIFNKIWIVFQQEILGKPIDRRHIRTKGELSRNRYILIGSIIVLFVTGFVVINNAMINAESQRRIQENMDILETLDSQVKNIKNKIIANQFASASEKQLTLTQLDELAAKARVQKEKGFFTDEFTQVINEIQLQKDLLQKINAILQPEIIANLDTISSDVSTTDLEYAEGALFVADEGTDAIYKIIPEIGATPEKFISNVVDPYILVKNIASEIIVYDKDINLSLGKFNTINAESLIRFPGITPPTFGTPKEAAIFSGNDLLYEIRPNHQQIFRREKLGDGYLSGGAVYEEGNPPNWKTAPELSDAIDIEVPFEIYALVEGLGLRRYLSGGENSIAFESFIDLSQEDYELMRSATALDVEGNIVVVGDSISQKVLLFSIEDSPERRLQLIKQYQYRGNENIFNDIKEIQVVPNDGKIFVLDGTRVIRLTL